MRWDSEHLEYSGAARVGAAIRTVSRRFRRFAFRYDALELRQLLSVGQCRAGVVVQPAISAAPLFSSSTPAGLSPSQVNSAYGVNQINFGNVTGNGAGQTIAIIDSYYDPNILSDLKQFDSQYGLQDPPSFTQYVENGLSANNAIGLWKPCSTWNGPTPLHRPPISCLSRRSPT